MTLVQKKKSNPKLVRGKLFIFGGLALLLLCTIIYLCLKTSAINKVHHSAQEEKTNLYTNELALSVDRGRVLATQHCQSCHLLPNPNLLDKENWPAALAMMAPRLGIYYYQGKGYPIFTDVDQSVYPAEPAMSNADWQHIIDYYTVSAPAALPLQKRPKKIKRTLPFFSVELPQPMFFRPGNTASYVKIDTSVNPHRLFVNRSSSNTLYLLNNKLQLLDSLQTNGPLVNIHFAGNTLVACKIGTDLFGNNAKLGQPIQLQINQRGKLQAATDILFDSLARPLQITSVDINGDNRKDYLVCEFGNMFGSLLWMENQGNGKYIRHNIRAIPGATKAIITDVNHDGRPDIWAQFAQGEETICLFINHGNGHFSQQQVLQFPPTYGSTSFELQDFNHDGFPDILYTCGDRGDGIGQLKPYQGVYIFLNNGQNKFTQKYFFPVNGCMKAMACDFDQDGDLDIASIGFFTDNQQPEEGFIYLENNGHLDFEPFALPAKLNFTKATTLDVADLNADGKPDIVLGHGFMGNKAMNVPNNIKKSRCPDLKIKMSIF